jgi:uncharacterized protein (TIGR03435 family)
MTRWVGILICLCSSSLFGQSALQPLSFEVASIRRAETSDSVVGGRGGAGGARSSVTLSQATYWHFDMFNLLIMAFHVKPYQISGPAWLRDVRYDITAKIPAGASRSQVPLMLQKLLQDRFNLTFHKDTRKLHVYALLAAGKHSRLQEVIDDPTAIVSERVTVGSGHLSSSHISMAGLAEKLASFVDLPIVDMSGIEGNFNVTLNWDPEESQPGSPQGGDKSLRKNGQDLFMALRQQLGLQLKVRNEWTDFVIIDHLEKTPIAN